MTDTQRMLIESYQLTCYLKEKLLSKNITLDDCIYMKACARKLLELTNGQDAHVYIFLGKISILEKKYHMADTYFNSAKKINITLPSIYYGLYKSNILQCKYDVALENAELFALYSGYDFEVEIVLLKQLLGQETSSISNKDSIFNNRKVKESILRNYNLMIDAINSSDYYKALRHLSVCIKLSKKDNLHIDYSLIETVLNILKERHYDKQRKVRIVELRDSILNTNNPGDKYMFLKKILEISPDNINAIIVLIDVCIDFCDYNMAKEYIEMAKKLNHSLD
jgi:tetratricopeptide (TPR) repeat protein